MMHRKDYKLIATAIRNAELSDEFGRIRKEVLVEKFCDELRFKNERFDEQKFKEACYGKETT